MLFLVLPLFSPPIGGTEPGGPSGGVVAALDAPGGDVDAVVVVGGSLDAVGGSRTGRPAPRGVAAFLEMTSERAVVLVVPVAVLAAALLTVPAVSPKAIRPARGIAMRLAREKHGAPLGFRRPRAGYCAPVGQENVRNANEWRSWVAIKRREKKHGTVPFRYPNS
ncbi:hypothetical protein GCM10020001_029990 [Nonomuraea salmonea]